MALDKNQVAITVGVVVPLCIFLLCVILVCFIRWRRNHSRTGGYEPMKHDLDEEEIEFRSRMLEGPSDDIDDLFHDNVNGSDGYSGVRSNSQDEDDEDINFDSKDMDRLSILEKFRNNLVAATNGESGRVVEVAEGYDEPGVDTEAQENEENMRL